MLAHGCQELKAVRAYIESKLIPLIDVSDVCLLILVKDRMNQGFIEIEYEKLLLIF